jgi:hypothetical protein
MYRTKNKSQFVDKFKEWYAQCVQSKGFSIRRIRCDNGTEIKNYKFNDFLTYISAKAQFTSTYSPPSDGVAERAHQTIIGMANSLRHGTSLPNAAWAEMVKTACFIYSRLPCRLNPGCVSPHQMIYNIMPNVSFFRTIGCSAYVRLHKPERTNILYPTAVRGIFSDMRNLRKDTES